MARFLKMLLLFLLPVAMLVAVGETLARRAPNSYREKDRYIMEHGRDIHTLILGASYAYDGFDPSQLDVPAYNLANNSQTLEMDYRLLLHYAPQLPNLRRVILAIGYMTMVDPRQEDTDEWARITQYQLYMHMPLHSPLSRYNWEFANLYQFSEKVKQVLSGNPPLTCDSLGLALSNDRHPSPEYLARRAKREVALHTYPLDKYEYNLGYLNKIGDYCRAHGIAIEIISYPVIPEYAAAVDPRQDSLRVAAARHMTETYGAVWHDLFRSPHFTSADFSDPSHLNRCGAARLASQVKSNSE